jgi:hypothetical protein
VKATSGAYLHQLHEWTLIIIIKIHKNIVKKPFFKKPRVALNPHTPRKRARTRGAALQRPRKTAPLTGGAARQSNRGLGHLHPTQGVRELNHGHYVFLTWFRVSQCMTQVKDYEPLHGVRVGGSLTRGVGLRNIWFLEKEGQTSTG